MRPLEPRAAHQVVQDDAAAAALVTEHTVAERPSLVPELVLRTSPSLVAVWEATEAAAAAERPPPFWAFAWVGGQSVARYLLDRPALVAGRRVLDFATGGGLVALAARRAGAAAVTAVDIDPTALVAAAINARANALDVDLVLGDVVGTSPDVDVVLAGDVCYERRTAPRIGAWLRALARDRDLVLLGDGGRAFLPEQGLRLEARYEVTTTREIESAERRGAAVWRVLPG